MVDTHWGPGSEEQRRIGHATRCGLQGQAELAVQGAAGVSDVCHPEPAALLFSSIRGGWV